MSGKRPLVWVSHSRACPDNHPIPPGYDAIYAPLLTMQIAEKPPPPPRRFDVLVFTSQNAVSIFCALTTRRAWQCFAVGKATAHALEHAGFENIVTGPGTSAALAAQISAKVTKPQTLYYARGADIAFDLGSVLRRDGYTVREEILYQSVAAGVPERATSTDFIFIYSRKGAQALQQIDVDLSEKSVISISENAAVPLRNGGKSPKQIYVASAPKHAQMVAEMQAR